MAVSRAVVHLALLAVIGVGVGCGHVVGKIGLAGTSPFIFALYRQSIATPLLTAWSVGAEGPGSWSLARGGFRRDLGQFVLAGFLLATSIICYAVAVKLANPILGAAWQASTPVWASAIAIPLGWERATPSRVVGIALSLAGAAFIVLYDAVGELGTGSDGVIGNILFFFNATTWAGYSLATRPLRAKKYPALMITAATGYVIIGFVAITVFVAHSGYFPIPDLDARDDEFDDDEVGDDGNNGTHHHGNSTGAGLPWEISEKAGWALGYFVVVYSILMYGTINWANKYVPPSTVVLYTVFQPVSASVLSVALIETGFTDRYPDVKLDLPGYSALGAIGVVLGILLITFGERAAEVPLSAARKQGTDAGTDDADDDDVDDGPLLRVQTVVNNSVNRRQLQQKTMFFDFGP